MQEVHVPEDKKDRIIRAAMENFSKNGYKKATMDEIVLEAGISKGLIFHYFGSKKKLYLFLYEFAYGLVYNRVIKGMDMTKTDLFERIRQAEQIKLEILKQYPYVLDFLASVHRETDAQLQDELEQRKRRGFPDWTPFFLFGVDTFKLRKEFEVDKIVKVILWCTNGILAEHKEHFVLEEIFAEIESYLDMMRLAFYNEVI